MINDKIFSISGLNYRLNTWFKEELKSKGLDQKEISLTKNLIIIDIDSLIFKIPEFEKKFKLFVHTLDEHSKKMVTNKKFKARTQEEFMNKSNKNISNQLRPYSLRNIGGKFPITLLMEQFEELI